MEMGIGPSPHSACLSLPGANRICCPTSIRKPSFKSLIPPLPLCGRGAGGEGVQGIARLISPTHSCALLAPLDRLLIAYRCLDLDSLPAARGEFDRHFITLLEITVQTDQHHV